MTNAKRTLIGFLLRYQEVIFLVALLAMLLGVAALVLMPRDEYPQFRMPLGIIVGVYPGASSEEVETQLTARVEQHLFQYKTVNRAKTYSISREDVMVVYVFVDGSEEELADFWSKLQHGLNSLKAELPAGVLSLTADNDFGNTSALLLAVQSETKSYKELEIFVKHYEEEVRRIPSISRIKHFGLQREQISVYLEDAKLASYGIKPLQVLAALRPPTSVAYAGEVNDGELTRPIHIASSMSSENDVANQIVYSDPAGTILRVKDVARVVREYEEPDSYIRVNGKKCLIVSLEMQPGRNIVTFGREVNKVTARFAASLPPDVRIYTISNIPDVVARSIGNFLKEFGISMLSVIAVTLLLLPARVARIAALSIPASIFTALGIMWIWGLDLQTVSLAGLILVLGITVDDAMVVIDNYIEKLDHGMSRFDAGSKSVTELFSSVLSATLVIISCFVPMPFFMSGTGEDFLRSLPATITFALLASLLVAVSLIPLVSYHLIRSGIKDRKTRRGGRTFLDRMQSFYDQVVDTAFRHKKWVVGTGLVSLLAGLALLATIPQQSFPKIERNQFAVEVFLPPGSSLQQTDTVLKELETTLAADPRIELVTSFVGASSPRFHSLYSPNFPARHYGQMVVLTTSNEATIQVLDEYSEKLYNRFPLADIKWKQLAFDIQKSPIEVRLSGDDIPVLKKTAENVMEIMRSLEGTEFIRTDYGLPLPTAELILKRDEAARLGYSNPLLAYSLMTGTGGFPASTVWEGDYPVTVKVKVDKKVKSSPQEILDQHVTSPYLATTVPVRQIADLKPGWSEAEIVRRNGVRTLTVRCEVARRLYPAEVFTRLKPRVDRLALPEGVSLAYGGDYQDTLENMTPFYYSLATSIVLIFLILMVQYKRVKSALLIMMTLPLSVFGAAVGVFLTGYPFGVTAFVGVIGLMGIVVRNGVIFVTYADELRHEQGLAAAEAAMAAGKRRMRPIFLTSAAAAVGVIPMILSGSTLWGPAAAAICSGLVFALALSLLVLPVLYYYFHRNDVHPVTESAAS
ncbi:MAG TPA: efflux RND transporter permease subunit [bacterium]|nr:efflux RND transporter permease subunit [bacterium]